jgi:hypothetical protein
MSRQSKPEEAVMAGDGGRAPDASGLRAALVETLRNDRSGLGTSADAERIAGLVLAVLSDPASVLAALLAEQPDATVAALETLLTNEGPVRAAAHVMYEAPPEADVAHVWDVALSAACRSLRPKAPKEDRDA